MSDRRRLETLGAWALAGLSACATPSASSPQPSNAPADAGDAADPAAAPARRYAQLAGRLELHAQPEAGARAVSITPARAVEILAERGDWWEVRTLSPEQARELGLAASAGLGIVELRGWIAAQPSHELTPRAPAEASSGSSTASSARSSEIVSEAQQLPFLIPAGAALYWPDGSPAGVALQPHGFHGTADDKSVDGVQLLCHSQRSGTSVGVISGPLCVKLDDVREGAALGDEKVVTLDAALVPTGAGSEGIKGALDKDQIREVVRAHVGDVRSCYNAGLVKDPQLAGRVTIDFVIGGDGHVSSAVIRDDNLDDPKVGPCIADAASKWVFPQPRGGGNVIVTYPFNLVPG